MSPKFFKIIDGKNKGSDKKKKEYASYDTAMEHIYKLASGIDFRKGKEKFAEYIPISSMLNVEQTNTREDTETYQKAVERLQKRSIRKTSIRSTVIFLN